MGNTRPILLGQNMTPRFLIWFISTNIPTVLANFLGIHNPVFSKNIGRDRGNTNLGSSEGLTVGNLGTMSSGWNHTSSPSCDIPFQSEFLPHSSQFLIISFLNCTILIKSTSV